MTGNMYDGSNNYYSPNQQTGQWICPNCGTINTTEICRGCHANMAAFASRPICRCPVCHKILPPGAIGCSACGWGMTAAWTCTNCGTQNAVTSTSCRQCGALQASLTPPVHNNRGMMIWSIVSLFPCIIPGVMAIIRVNKANASKSANEENEYLQSAKKLNIAGSILGVLAIIVILLSVLLTESDRDVPTVTDEPSTYTSQSASLSTPEPTIEPVSDDGSQYLDDTRDLMEDGDYHGAMQKLVEFSNNYPDSPATDEADELYIEIATELSLLEPETGELERTIQYQGGGKLQVYASSGPAVITVTNINNTSSYSRFYVRQYDTAVVNFPSGTYSVVVERGVVWFGDDIGFGDFCSTEELEEYLDFEYSADNAWISNSVWSFTV